MLIAFQAAPVLAQDTSPLGAPLITTPTPVSSISPPSDSVTPTATPVVIVVAPSDATSVAPVLPEINPTETIDVPPTSFWPLAMQIFESAIRSLGWLWFLCGSLVFFVTAGLFAGQGLLMSNRSRYALLALPNAPAFDDFAVNDFSPDDFALSENRPLNDKESAGERSQAQPPRSRSASAADDYWPASLP